MTSFSFKDELARIRVRIAEDASHHLILHHDHSDMPLWKLHLSADSHFCRAVVANGFLTQEQMSRAALRYRLGMARDGGVIFWQIDQCEQTLDGKIMYYQDNCHRDHFRHPTWVSSELRRFYLGDDFPHEYLPESCHCLFGTHLLSHSDPTGSIPATSSILAGQLKPVAIVEAEKTAIICSERYPRFIWLAPGGLEALKPEVLYPLRGRKIILFPDTDETGDTFAKWHAIAQSSQRLLGQPIYVSDFLERHATPDQKRRKIDLVDLIMERHKGITEATGQ